MSEAQKVLIESLLMSIKALDGFVANREFAKLQPIIQNDTLKARKKLYATLKVIDPQNEWNKLK